MDGFLEALPLRAATIDELLSSEFEALPGQKANADTAARRLSAWCRASSSGNWSLFDQRLNRDRLTFAQVLSRFSTVRRKPSGASPLWIEDAMWIDAALQSPNKAVECLATLGKGGTRAFEHLFAPLIEQANLRLWTSATIRVTSNLNVSSRASLCLLLLDELSTLCVPAIFECFVRSRKTSETFIHADTPQLDCKTFHYDRFINHMKAEGFRTLFEEKPVLLRLIAEVTRQWIETTRVFVLRLEADLIAVRQELLGTAAEIQVSEIEGGLSDPHNGGRSVLIVKFEDGARAVYKPKDLRLDAAWHSLLDRLDRDGAPIKLQAMRVLVRDGYGWTEFIEHRGCADEKGFKQFFRRGGAWLAIFHCFAGADMHQENMIASGEHPVPIDLEMILQSRHEERLAEYIEAQAFASATDIINNSVLMVGLLPRLIPLTQVTLDVVVLPSYAGVAVFGGCHVL